MSIRSHSRAMRGANKTDPKWYPTTQGLHRWLNRMAERQDLTVRVLKRTDGAPARFIPAVAEIDISEALISQIDPIIAGSPEFVVKHRAVAGACVHEAAHARHSTRIDLSKIQRQHGARHAAVFAMLEEGRCETQQWPNLNGVERLALQSMVLEIVLRDIQDEDGKVPPLDIRVILRLTGLLSARIEVGIVDVNQPQGKRMHDALMGALGVEFASLYDIAVRFSNVGLDWYGDGEDRLHSLVREWIAVEDTLIPPADEDGSGGEDGEEGDEDSEGESQGGSGKGKSKPEGSGDPGDSGDADGEDEDSEGEGDGGSKPEDGGESEDDKGAGDKGIGDDDGTEDDIPGDDDEGTVGDGSNILDPSDEGDAALGEYASSSVEEDAADVFRDIFDAVRDAAEEAESISGSRLREALVPIHRANASAHAERRRRNAEAAKRWR